MNLNESKALKDIAKALNEAVTEESQKNKRPEGSREWTFTDWFGRDLSGETYEGNLFLQNVGITSLRGAPEIVEGDFDCHNNQLTSLEGAPKEVGGYFNCDNSQLTSLKGAPNTVGGDFGCFYNQLTSLKGAPNTVGGDFCCSYNQLTSFEGAPKEVGGSFNCHHNRLTSLEGAPEKVGGYFSCNNNQLTSLEGAPKEVGGSFDCRNNQLTSLKGAPEKIGGSFDCRNNPLTSLKGAPEKIGGSFNYSENQSKSPKNSKYTHDKIASWKFEEDPDGITSSDGWGYQHDIGGFVCFSDVIISNDSLLDEFFDFTGENGLEVEPRAFLGVDSSKWTIGIDFEVEVTEECDKDEEKCYYDIIPDKKDAKEAAKRLIEEYNKGTLQKWMKEHGIKIGKNPSIRMFLVDLEYA